MKQSEEVEVEILEKASAAPLPSTYFYLQELLLSGLSSNSIKEPAIVEEEVIVTVVEVEVGISAETRGEVHGLRR